MKVFDSFTDELASMIKDDAIGVIPTDTVYGIVGSLTSDYAIAKIYKIKTRPELKPVGTVVIAGSKQIHKIVDAQMLEKAEKYWPGKSVILEMNDDFHYAHRGVNSLPFRIPDLKELRNFLESVGPLATTSANFAGEPPVTNIDQAISLFGDNLDFYVDGGDLSGRKPSKIVKILKNGEVEVIR